MISNKDNSFEQNLWCNNITEHISAAEKLKGDSEECGKILKSANIIAEALRRKSAVFIFGNGGSAADAQHIAAEFTGKFARVREPWNVMALTTNTSVLSSIGNDIDFKYVFLRQTEAAVKSGDVVIGITTSGKSENVLCALSKAHEKGAATIALTSAEADDSIADTVIKVPSTSTPRVQELHILVGHFWANYAEEFLDK